MTDKPIYKNGHCVAEHVSRVSDIFTSFDNPETEEEEVVKNMFEYLHDVGWRVTLACAISLGLATVFLYLFRYAAAATVWSILILSWLLFVAGTVFVWIVGMKTRDKTIVFAVMMSIMSLALLCLICFLHNKVRLVSLLFKESTKALFDMPKIFLITIMTILLLVAITVACTVTTIYAASAGRLMKVNYDFENKHLAYVADGFMLMTMCFNAIIAYWAIEFVYGIQYMVVSGAVAKWYFTKDKNLLGNPILTSAIITFKYHLGTVAFGSLLVTLVAVIRVLLRSLSSNPRMRYLVECCIGFIEGFLRFLSRNAYIVTAMHGTPFYKSGKQAVRLLTLNICNTIAISSFGDFVIGISKLVVIAFSLGLTYCILLGTDQTYIWLPLLVVFAFSLIFAWTILATIQIVIDTMFLCFCDDCIINNGVSKPYAMPRGFMEFVEDSKKTYTKVIEKKGLPII